MDKKWKYKHVKYACPHSISRPARGDSRQRRINNTGCGAFIYASVNIYTQAVQILRLNLDHTGHELTKEALIMTDPSQRNIDVTSNPTVSVLIENNVSTQNLLKYVQSEINPNVIRKDIVNLKSIITQLTSHESFEKILKKFVTEEEGNVCEIVL